MKNTWQRLISRVPRLTGHFIGPVLAGERRANQNGLRLLLRCLRQKGNPSFYITGLIEKLCIRSMMGSKIRTSMILGRAICVKSSQTVS